MAVSKRLRYEVLRRDNHTCRYCHATDSPLTVDHVTPVALGGTDTAANLVACCRDCNAGKSSVHPDAPLVENVAEDALRWAAAMRIAASFQEDRRIGLDVEVEEFDRVWNGWTYPDGRTVARPAVWKVQVRRWLSDGVEIDTLTALIDDVLPRPIADDRMWPYFYGAVKNTLNERMEMARRYLDATEGS